jgi:hypothetical protein
MVMVATPRSLSHTRGRSAAPILPHNISPKCSAAPKGSGGSPCACRTASRWAMPARAADKEIDEFATQCMNIPAEGEPVLWGANDGLLDQLDRISSAIFLPGSPPSPDC